MSKQSTALGKPTQQHVSHVTPGLGPNGAAFDQCPNDSFDTTWLKDHFLTKYGQTPRIFSAPGRVNLIGEHTDYNDGFALPFAIQLRTYVAASRRSDRVVSVSSLNADGSHEFQLDKPSSLGTRRWFNYVEGTARSLELYGRGTGANLLLASNLPQGVGLSSSASLELAIAFALVSLGNSTSIGRLQMALAGQRAEHDYVGTKVGIMDQFVCAFGRRNHALLLDCRTVSANFIPLNLSDTTLVVCDSGVDRNLATSAYNQRRAECALALQHFKRKRQTVRALRDVTLLDLLSAETDLTPTAYRRARHVITENERTKAAAAAFEAGNLRAAGELMVASHASLRSDYEVSSPELDFLVERAGAHPGVFGSRMTGAGFGGCTIHLMEKASLPTVEADLKARYHQLFGKKLRMFVVRPSEGVQEHERATFLEWS